MSESLWYAGGLRFSCTRCSACCRGESGYVFLSPADTRIMAAELKMSKSAFTQTYCRAVDGKNRLSLKETSGGDCVLWKNGCAVYPARPAQCRTYPFWPSALVSEETWKEVTADCPGTREGELRDAAYIERLAAQEAANIRAAGGGSR